MAYLGRFFRILSLGWIFLLESGIVCSSVDIALSLLLHTSLLQSHLNCGYYTSVDNISQ